MSDSEQEAIKALEKIVHDRRWERDGFGQLRYGKEEDRTSVQKPGKANNL